MRRVMVRYSVRPETAAENQARIEAVFAELKARAPAGVRYASFRLDDGVSFVHVASIETGHDNPLLALDAFRAFSSTVKDRCVAPPVTTELHEVGAYRFFDG